MKVFLSWSGDLSRSIAMVLGEMLPQVLQIVDPYFSPDIEKGARWAIDLARELEAAKFGIICVTPDNIDAPWLNFEAGALSKALDTGRVTPFLVGMRAANLRGPLVQFQATVAEKEDVWKLVRSLNQKTETFQLDETKLRKGFEKWWPELDEGITAAQSDAKMLPPLRCNAAPDQRSAPRPGFPLLARRAGQHRDGVRLPRALRSRSRLSRVVFRRRLAGTVSLAHH